MRIVICSGCVEAVISERCWIMKEGRRVRVVREPRDDEQAMVQCFLWKSGWTYKIAKGRPGDLHECPRQGVIRTCTKPPGPDTRLPFGVHARVVTRGDLVECQECHELGLMFDDLPFLIAPGFVQREKIRRLLSHAELARYTIAVGAWDGTASAHYCGVLVEGSYEYRELECGQGEGRDFDV